jgi:uncharacterized repeat protein (TIGR02543 family)
MELLGVVGRASGSTNPLQVTMDGNKTITANFTQITYTLTVNTSGQGTVTRNPSQANYPAGSTVTLTATPASGWSFSGWSGSASGSTNPLQVTMDGNKTITANFTQITYTLTVNTSGQGSVTRNPNQANYNAGSTVTLTATPASGWSFSGWSGSASGSTNPLQVTMDGNKTITANFTQITYTLTVNTSGQGSVTRNPNQASYNAGSTVTLTATPASGWSFSGWSGSASGSTNPLQVTMDGNKTITANFNPARLVLLEHFTNAYNQNSITANQIVYDVARANPLNVAFISYHTSFPESDPINSRNVADPAARVLYYDVNAVPLSVMDGNAGRYNYSPSAFNERDLLDRAMAQSRFDIGIKQNQTGNTLNIEVEISSLAGFGPREITLHVAVIQTEIPASVIGIAGNMVFRNVVTKLLPDAGGTSLPSIWVANQSASYSFNWTIANVFNPEKLALVAFVQDEITREVYDTGISSEFSVPNYVDQPGPPGIEPPDNSGNRPVMVFYPNPAKDFIFIEFQENLIGDHTLEIYNLSGNMIRTEILKAGRSNYEFNTSALPAGIYLFKIMHNRNTLITSRIMIMN